MKFSRTSLMSWLAGAALVTTSLAGCASDSAAKAEMPAEKATLVRALDRASFNRIAAELNLPLFWRGDDNENGAIDPAELAVLWGFGEGDVTHWVKEGAFTTAATTAFAAIDARLQNGEVKDARRALVREELAQGRTTLVETDLNGTTAGERRMVALVLEAAKRIEGLFAKQRGTTGLDAGIAADDTESRMMFWRNQGPWCEAPKTGKNPGCAAVLPMPKRVSGLYPAELQSEGFCDTLQARPDAKTLMSPFVTVAYKDGAAHVADGAAADLVAVPYTDAFKAEMTGIAALLTEAADALSDADEKPFQAYLRAAAQGFTTNDWEPANAAWAAMNVHNSKWYLRIGPDEVYFEPCSRKAGFHVSFARINPGSLAWQKKLEPVKQDMENALAALAGKPYTARTVAFHLPDFIDIVINAGDARSSRGATIGQSLPNWGPVAAAGGRTVAMTNLYTDADSKAAFMEQAASLFCSDTMARMTAEPGPQVMSTVLHEAAHNLGPAHEYAVDGKTDDAIFGGAMASMLEELKAQTAALYFTDWLAKKGIITAEEADVAHLRDVAWAFGHISNGLYSESGRMRPYSALAAIQVGHLLTSGAMQFKADTFAHNQSDKGCYSIAADKTEAAIDALSHTVLAIKGSGDVAGAEKLKAAYVDDKGAIAAHWARVKERWLRAPKASFVYSVKNGQVSTERPVAAVPAGTPIH